MAKVTKNKRRPSIAETVQTTEAFELTVQNIGKLEEVFEESKPLPPPYVPGTIEVYSFHPQTGEYLGATVADESPLEPGVWHLPAFSTQTAPPEYQAGLVRVWNGQAWEFKSEEKKEATGAAEEDIAAAALKLRNQLLAASDWTQLPDVQTSAAWRVYRQALRDLTKQEGYPHSIEWPVPPTI